MQWPRKAEPLTPACKAMHVRSSPLKQRERRTSYYQNKTEDAYALFKYWTNFEVLLGNLEQNHLLSLPSFVLNVLQSLRSELQVFDMTIRVKAEEQLQFCSVFICSSCFHPRKGGEDGEDVGDESSLEKCEFVAKWLWSILKRQQNCDVILGGKWQGALFFISASVCVCEWILWALAAWCMMWLWEIKEKEMKAFPSSSLSGCTNRPIGRRPTSTRAAQCKKKKCICRLQHAERSTKSILTLKPHLPQMSECQQH